MLIVHQRGRRTGGISRRHEIEEREKKKEKKKRKKKGEELNQERRRKNKDSRARPSKTANSAVLVNARSKAFSAWEQPKFLCGGRGEIGGGKKVGLWERLLVTGSKTELPKGSAEKKK